MTRKGTASILAYGYIRRVPNQERRSTALRAQRVSHLSLLFLPAHAPYVTPLRVQKRSAPWMAHLQRNYVGNLERENSKVSLVTSVKLAHSLNVKTVKLVAPVR
jgi:hypothetical protein